MPVMPLLASVQIGPALIALTRTCFSGPAQLRVLDGMACCFFGGSSATHLRPTLWHAFLGRCGALNGKGLLPWPKFLARPGSVSPDRTSLVVARTDPVAGGHDRPDVLPHHWWR